MFRLASTRRGTQSHRMRGRFGKPRWHLWPCGHRNATGRDFQKIAILSRANRGQRWPRAFGISRRRTSPVCDFSQPICAAMPPTIRTSTTATTGGIANASSPAQTGCANLSLLGIDYVQGETAKDQYARASPRMRVSVIQMTRTSRAMDQWPGCSKKDRRPRAFPFYR